MSSESQTGGSGISFEPLVPAGAACAVKLPIFEGPLDLLLHLIRINEVDITDIPIAQIGAQYLEYLELMQELSLDVAGEYLLMAATLAWIKSRMLLPPDDSEEEEETDPRAELVRRLLEYQRFKEVAEELDGRPRLGRDVFCIQTGAFEPAGQGEREIEVDALDLIEALRHVLAEAHGPAPTHEVDVETVTVKQRMLALMELLGRTASLEFREVFVQESASRSRAMIVATFLALLELSRLGAVRIYQGLGGDGAPEGPIRIRRSASAEESRWQEQISELM